MKLKNHSAPIFSCNMGGGECKAPSLNKFIHTYTQIYNPTMTRLKLMIHCKTEAGDRDTWLNARVQNLSSKRNKSFLKQNMGFCLFLQQAH